MPLVMHIYGISYPYTEHIPYHCNTCNNMLLITLSLHTYNHSFSSVFVPLPLTIYFVVAKHNLHSDSFEVLNSPHFLTSTCFLGVGLGQNCIPHIRNIQYQPYSVEAHKGQLLQLHWHSISIALFLCLTTFPVLVMSLTLLQAHAEQFVKERLMYSQGKFCFMQSKRQQLLISTFALH